MLNLPIGHKSTTIFNFSRVIRFESKSAGATHETSPRVKPRSVSKQALKRKCSRKEEMQPAKLPVTCGYIISNGGAAALSKAIQTKIVLISPYSMHCILPVKINTIITNSGPTSIIFLSINAFECQEHFSRFNKEKLSE